MVRNLRSGMALTSADVPLAHAKYSMARTVSKLFSPLGLNQARRPSYSLINSIQAVIMFRLPNQFSIKLSIPSRITVLNKNTFTILVVRGQ